LQELKELNQEIEDFVKGAPVWKDKDALLQSVPGVGPVTSATMLGMLSGLGKLNAIHRDLRQRIHANLRRLPNQPL